MDTGRIAWTRYRALLSRAAPSCGTRQGWPHSGPSLTLAFASPAKAANYRGIVGVIKPRATDSSLVDMIKLLPEGIGVIIPVYLNLTQGSREEYGNSYAIYEKHITYLASRKCNVIAIEGAPPFMLLGPAREAEMVDGWKQKYNTDMFTSSQNQVNAFKALNVKRILGITSGSGGRRRLHQEGLCRAQGRGCRLHPGFVARSTSFDCAAGTRAGRTGRASGRRAHLGNPEAP